MGNRTSILLVTILLLSQVFWVQPATGLEEWTPTVGASAGWQTLEAWSSLQSPLPPPTARPPIYIAGDNEFTSANGVVGGDGSENNPFIIENWVIDASQADGIHIKNTTKYFVIRNVVVYNGSLYFNGIYPDNIVANSNQRLDNCYYGIYLENVINGRVESCVLENNFDGIFLGNSTNNVFLGNSIRNSTRFGIYLYYSDNNTFINNTIKRSGFYDIVGAEFGLSILPNGALTPAVGRISENNLFKANWYENAVAVPHVVNVKVSVTHDSATISWAIRCDGGDGFITTVEYGLTPSYGYRYTVSGVYPPSVTLSGLSASTTYHFRIISTSSHNNTEITSDNVFTTSSPPPPPPPPPLTETAITIEPYTFNLSSGGSLTLTATLKTSGGQPLKGKTLTWDATSGVVSPTSGVTDDNGQVRVTYTAPIVGIIQFVTITASFAGDSTYASSKGISTGIITPVPPAPTILTVTPSSFKLAPGDNLVLQALLTDENRNPLAGRTILWSADKGTLSTSKTVTDNSGRATVTYTAPPVTAPETVTITASFAGEALYGLSQASSVGTVSPIGTVMSIALPTYIGSGENLTVLVALVDEAGNFLSGKTIKLAASLGTVILEFSTTDNSGRATFTYSAPLVTAPTFDFLTASFAGDGRYASSVAVKEIAVLPPAAKETVENVVENVKSAGESFEIPLENELVKAVENATIRGNLGAVVTVTILVDKPGLSKGFERQNIRTRLEGVIVGERVEVAVESDVENGSTVLINLDNRVLPVGWIREVLMDNEPAILADDYADVLDPNNDNGRPEYLILKGGKGAQILVSIPHFSARVITIRGPLAAPTAWSPLLVAVAIVIIALVLLLVFRRRGSFPARGNDFPNFPRKVSLFPRFPHGMAGALGEKFH